MKLKLLFLAVVFFALFLLTGNIDFYLVPQGRKEDEKTITSTTDSDTVSVIQSFLDLDSDGKEESFRFNTYVGLPGEEWTQVFLNDTDTPVLSVVGYFEGAFVHDIDDTKEKLLEIQTSSGHSINSLVYRYHKGSLIRIPVSTEQEGFFEGVVSRNSPDFIDVDGDGVKEMIVYYREFPPDYRRTVEVYQWKKGRFEKVREYEEETQGLFL